MNYYQIILTTLTIFAVALVVLIIIGAFQPTPASVTKESYPVNVFAIDDIHEEFNQIYLLPYDVENMNCKHKASLFIKVLQENGATDIRIMDFARSDNGCGHEAVLWNNGVYDPTSGIWNMSRTQYIKMITHKGFSGTLIEVTV